MAKVIVKSNGDRDVVSSIPAYTSQYENNPYNGQDPTAQLSGWNKFTDGLGITNNADRVRYQQNQASALWDSERSAALEDREYNNEVNTSRRMRAAGMNPDLLGVQAGQSELANNDAVANGVNGAMSTESDSPMQVVQSLGSVMSNVFGIYNGLASLDNQIFSTEMSAFVNNEDSIKSDLVSSIGSRATPDAIDKFLSGKLDINEILFGDEHKTTTAADSYELLKMITPRYKSKRMRDFAARKLSSYINSLDFQRSITDKFGSVASAKNSASRAIGENTALAGKSGGNLRETMHTIASCAYDIYMSDLSLQKLANKYSRDYYSTASGTTAAEAENSTTRETIDAMEYRNNIRKPWRNLVNRLARQSEEGNLLSSIALTGILGSSNIVNSPVGQSAVSAALRKPNVSNVMNHYDKYTNIFNH